MGLWNKINSLSISHTQLVLIHFKIDPLFLKNPLYRGEELGKWFGWINDMRFEPLFKSIINNFVTNSLNYSEE